MTDPIPNPSERSLSRKIARKLREEILRVPDGTFLGSEEDLIERLGVSRPTFRQVARLLEHEQILVVKRGVKGGCFAQRPQVTAVAAAAALYLRATHTNLRQLFAASHGLVLEAVRLACDCRDEEKRSAFGALVDRFRQTGGAPQSLPQFMVQESEFNDALLALAENPPIELFLKAIYHFGRYDTDERFYADRQDRMQTMADLRIRLGEAVLSRDADMSALLVKRRASVVALWIDELPERDLALRLAQS